MSNRGKNMCRFTKELDEKLIELVSKNDVLFNSNHAFYKDIGHRDDVWQAISSMVGKSVQDCKTRWRSLRDLYHRKRNEEKRGTRKKKHVWEYMDALSFLDDRRSLATEALENENDENDKTIETKPDIGETEIKIDPLEASPPPNKKIKTENDVKDPTTLKSNFVLDNTFCNTTLQLLRDIKNATNTKQHPVMTFFESMARTVMGFPPALAAEAKLKVCQIVTEIECRILEDTGEYPENFTNYS